MPSSLALEVKIENFDFFKYKFLKFLLSPAQKIVMQTLKMAHKDISRLKKQEFFEFTASNEFHISRGDDYAITDFLQERLALESNRLNDLHAALELKKISLDKLQAALAIKNNNLDDLHSAIEQKGINLQDLYAVIQQKEISLENLQMALELKKISLEDLQEAFEKNYHIDNKEILSFIILCLVEPVWIPGSLSALVNHLLLPTDYRCSNLSGIGAKKTGLQVTKDDSNAIEFCFDLHIIDNNISNLVKGSTSICFSIEKTFPLQIKLLPITMQLNFSNEQASKHFQQKLAKNFKGWLFHQNESDYIPIKLDEWRAMQIDFLVFPILIGLLIGLSAMISLIALGLTPMSPLLLPPLGLALGLGLSVIMNSYVQVNIKKEQVKIQRPIHLLDKTQIQTTPFFNHPRSLNPSITAESQVVLNK